MCDEIRHVPFRDRLLPAPVGGGFAMDDYWLWCGSVIRGDDDRYHMFAARWPKRMKFLPGYQSYSEVVRAVSAKPEGPYTFREVVLGDRGPDYWDGRMTHNPVVVRRGGRYLLFYIGTTFSGQRPNAEQLRKGPDFRPWYRDIRIGVATSDSVFGPWRRQDRPLLSPRPDRWDHHVVTNPAPCVTEDGRLLLYYRSSVPGVGQRIGLAVFDDLEAPCRYRSEEPLFDAAALAVEDPCVFELDGHYEMLVKDLNDNLTGELHSGAHMLSVDGFRWRPAPRVKAYSREVLWSDGKRRAMAHFERPQVLIEHGRPVCLCAAAAEGRSEHPGGFGELQRTWTAVIPLKDTPA